MAILRGRDVLYGINIPNESARTLPVQVESFALQTHYTGRRQECHRQ